MRRRPVPAGSERLRVTPTSAHSHADVRNVHGGAGTVWAMNAICPEGQVKLADYNGHLVTLCLMATAFAIGTDAPLSTGVLGDISIPLPSAHWLNRLISRIRAGLYAVRATDRTAARQRQPPSISCSWRWYCSSPAIWPALGHQLPTDLVRQSAGRIKEAACYTPQATAPPWGGGGKTPRHGHFYRLWGMTLAIALR